MVFSISGVKILAFQPFTTYFPCANIYEMILPDLLHQVIKGTFKDHLVNWVGLYLLQQHGKVAIFTGGQGDKTAYRAIEIRFRGMDGGVGRDNE
jgi:hypothetical protein